mgnify:CR=1 FL=1
MKPTMEILARISQNSSKNKEEVFTRLYRYLLRPDIYYEAYRNLYANSGAATKGVNEDTADGFSEAKINRIIKSLETETDQPKPPRRTSIQKASGKMRPLGIPTFTDKLVQEVLRLVLQAVYEPVFLNCSHGFRPNRSCHTALAQAKQELSGARWFIEGDIKGCFDHIDHTVLVGLVNRKIKDARLIKLLHKFLKAGYMEDWRYHITYSGTPQGGIISPILANIYLHELDKFVMKLKSEFDTHGQEPVRTEYRLLSNDLQKLSYHIGRRTGAEREQLLSEYNEKRKLMLKMPCTAQTKKWNSAKKKHSSLIAAKGQDFWGMMFVFAEAALSSMVGQAKRQNAPSTIPVNCLSHSMIRFTASFSPRKLRYRNRMGNSCLSAVNLFCDSQIWKSFLPTMRNCGESATTMELPAIFINCATFPISWNTVASKPSQVSINAP